MPSLNVDQWTAVDSHLHEIAIDAQTGIWGHLDMSNA